MNDDPADPISGLVELANQLHEAYTAYVAAGFTEVQALYLIACIACGGPKP